MPKACAEKPLPSSSGVVTVAYTNLPGHVVGRGSLGLYDIDRIIVYASVTATLLALYFVAIVASQRAFVALTGEKSTLAVVASTLAIAALFNPLRRRTQSFVDRRFYRRRYDAGKTLESFAGKLREETDLGALNDELVRVVSETMQPAHVSLWLSRDPAREDKRPG
ncbi:MAG: hypothetical protein H0U55_05325 [Rubrobacteraceae bacterium]|nr:hypothetical protein [Rubrobacteraceae bacterium]